MLLHHILYIYIYIIYPAISEAAIDFTGSHEVDVDGTLSSSKSINLWGASGESLFHADGAAFIKSQYNSQTQHLSGSQTVIYQKALFIIYVCFR